MPIAYSFVACPPSILLEMKTGSFKLGSVQSNDCQARKRAGEERRERFALERFTTHGTYQLFWNKTVTAGSIVRASFVDNHFFLHHFTSSSCQRNAYFLTPASFQQMSFIFPFTYFSISFFNASRSLPSFKNRKHLSNSIESSPYFHAESSKQSRQGLR